MIAPLKYLSVLHHDNVVAYRTVENRWLMRIAILSRVGLELGKDIRLGLGIHSGGRLVSTNKSAPSRIKARLRPLSATDAR